MAERTGRFATRKAYVVYYLVACVAFAFTALHDLPRWSGWNWIGVFGAAASLLAFARARSRPFAVAGADALILSRGMLIWGDERYDWAALSGVEQQAPGSNDRLYFLLRRDGGRIPIDLGALVPEDREALLGLIRQNLGLPPPGRPAGG